MMTETKPSKAQDPDVPPEHRQVTKAGGPAVETSPKKKEPAASGKMPLTIFYHWCKACNICIAYCPQKVFIPDRDGKPIIEYPDKCTQCAFCWMHCPDLAIVSNEK